MSVNKPKEALKVDEAPPEEAKVDRMDEVSVTSYGRTWANKESKFEDKLESYY